MQDPVICFFKKKCLVLRQLSYSSISLRHCMNVQTFENTSKTEHFSKIELNKY